MIDFAVKNAWLVLALPFLSALIITLFTKRSPLLSSRISRIAIFIGLLQSILIGIAAISDIDYVIKNSAGSLRWLTAGDINFYVSWKVDSTTALMIFVVTFISFLVQLYSREYMEEYITQGNSFSRYYAELSLFSFSMLLLVFTDNFWMLYAGWELVGVSSYLLIGYFYDKKSAAVAAKKAFLANRVGDFGFLIGILIIFAYTGSLNFDVVAAQIGAGKLSGELLTVAAILLFFGAIGKSGQFPLHVWLPDAMEGPTPVSALIHAATMVTAGVYMVAKIMVIFASAQFPALWGLNALDFVAIVGGITAIMAAFIALTQNDIKKILAYSTVSQLGFMVLALGMYTTSEGTIHPVGYTAAIFHLFTHAFFKAMLFLCSGSVIHACHTQDIWEMGGLRKYMPVTALSCLAGTAAISGFPLTAGFWSKDALLDSMIIANKFYFILAAIAATLTAFYMFRLYFVTFEGKYRGNGHPHEPGWRMKLPLVTLAIPSLLVGFIGTPWANYFGDFIKYIPLVHTVEEHHHGPNFIVMGISLLIFTVGFGLAFALYGKGNYEKADELSKKLEPLYKASSNKLYIDEAYQFIIDQFVLVLAKISALFDKFAIDLIVNGVSEFFIYLANTVRKLHNGKVQYYVMGIVVAVLLLIFSYTNYTKIVEYKNYIVATLVIAFILFIIKDAGEKVISNLKNKFLS